jgi:hypothetical protein
MNYCLSLLKDQMMWLNGRPDFGKTTPFSRIYHVWANVDQHSHEDTGSMQFIPQGDGYRWAFGRHGLPTETLDMRAWSKMSETAITRFQDAVTALIPSSDFMAKFCATPIDDNKTRVAPHRQAANQAWMAGLQRDLSHQINCQCLTLDGKFDSKQAKHWLKLEQTALQALAVVFCLTTGVTFRSWQFASIHYDCTESQNRNVWILLDGTFIISHPKAKQRNIDRAPTLLAFPHKISSFVAFYLYMIRPFACDLLKELELDHSAHLSILWVHSIPMGREKPRIGLPWDGSYLSNLLREFTEGNIGVAMSPLIIRQATQAVFRDKLPQLFYEGSNFTALDQHGHQCGFPFWPDLPVECSVRLLAVGQMWQALIGVASINATWMPVIQGSNAFFSQKQENLAIAILGAFKRGRYASEKNVSGLELQSVSYNSSMLIDRSALILGGH